MYVWVLLLQKDKAKDSEASRMTALLVEDNLSFSDPELIDDGGDDLRITSSEELPSTTSSISPTVSLSGSGASSLPCVTSKLSWTSQTFPSPLEHQELEVATGEFHGDLEVDESLVKMDIGPDMVGSCQL